MTDPSSAPDPAEATASSGSDALAGDLVSTVLRSVNGQDVPTTRKLIAAAAATIAAARGVETTITPAAVAVLIGEQEALVITHLKALATGESGILNAVPYLEEGRAKVGYLLT